jgi:hypothetical protein
VPIPPTPIEAIVIRLLGGTLPFLPRAEAATMYGRPIDPAVTLAAFLRNRRLEILLGIIIKGFCKIAG